MNKNDVKDIAFECIAKYHRRVAGDFRSLTLNHFLVEPGKKYLFIISEKEGYDIVEMWDEIRDHFTACLLEMGLSQNDFRIIMLGGIDVKSYAIVDD